MDYNYGTSLDIERLRNLRNQERESALCKLDKMPEGHLTSMFEARICDIGHPLLSTITQRYYKGVGGHKDNMVVIVRKHEKKHEKNNNSR